MRGRSSATSPAIPVAWAAQTYLALERMSLS